MSAIAAPFGLRPAFSPNGTIRPGPLGSIASAAAFDIFQNSPVALDTAGNLILAAAAARAIGTFQGVEYVDVEGRFRVSNRWIANTVATEIRAYYTQTQDGLIYEIQANATLTQAAIGDQFDWTAIAGNATTGLSSVALNVASAAGAGNNAGLRVVGLNPGPDNAWGDAFPIVLVQISEHQFTADRVAI